ncbi:MAG: hypothetical protein NTW59_00725, partial [Candidatus Diapherotrites archaeon]|nr:hypothetical protein [Candidatus Diapherotrites archaeon]
MVATPALRSMRSTVVLPLPMLPVRAIERMRIEVMGNLFKQGCMRGRAGIELSRIACSGVMKPRLQNSLEKALERAFGACWRARWRK